MFKRVPHSLLVSVAGLAAVGCGRSPYALSDSHGNAANMVGAWRQTERSIYGATDLAFRDDGTFSMSQQLTRFRGEVITVTINGTYTVHRDQLTITPVDFETSPLSRTVVRPDPFRMLPVEWKCLSATSNSLRLQAQGEILKRNELQDPELRRHLQLKLERL